MKNFIMSFRYNKQSDSDFGMEYKDGKYISEKDGSEWVKCKLYDFGWGKENGFYKIPLGTFHELIALVLSDEDKEDSYGAAAIIATNYQMELKIFLQNLMTQKINISTKEKLNEIFFLDESYNKTFEIGMTFSQIEKEYNDWKQIAKFYSPKKRRFLKFLK